MKTVNKILEILLIGAIITLLTLPLIAQEQDTNLQNLQKAKTEFEESIQKAKAKIEESLDKKIAFSQKIGNLKAYEFYKTELNEFKTKGKVPITIPLQEYNSSIKMATSKLENAYRQAIKSYTQEGKIDKAKEIDSEYTLLFSNELPANSEWHGHYTFKGKEKVLGDWHIKITERTNTGFKGILESDRGAGYWTIEGTVFGKAIDFKFISTIRGGKVHEIDHKATGTINNGSMELNVTYYNPGNTDEIVVKLATGGK